MAVKVLQKGHGPSPLGNDQIDIGTIVREATEFIAACYGCKCIGTISQIRFNIWQSKTGRNKATSFKLPSLLPIENPMNNTTPAESDEEKNEDSDDG